MKPAMRTTSIPFKTLGLTALAVAAFAGAAEARTSVSVGLGVPLGGEYYAPAPAYYAPPPAYYYAPPAYYPAPYYQPTYSGIWWGDGAYRHRYGYPYRYWRR